MIITVSGNLTGDPELRFTPSGAAVAKFNVAVNKRKFNRTTNEWEDGETTFVNCSAWRDMAENVAESLAKGTRVVLTGDLTSRQYEKDGQQRTAWECTVEDVGPSLKFATVSATRRSSSGGNRSGGGGQSSGGRPAQQPQSDPWGDPWSSGGQGQQQRDPWGGGEEPPF